MEIHEDAQHVYIIKKRVTIELSGEPFVYEELLGKCTSSDEAKAVIKHHPDAYIANDTTYDHSDLFRFEEHLRTI